MESRQRRPMSRRQMLRFAAGAAGAAAFGPVLAACGGSPGTQAGGTSGPAAQGGQTTVSMLGWGTVLEKENVDKSLQIFQQRNPDIKVEWLHTPNADYETKLKTMLAGGTPPDLFWTGNMLDYVIRDQVMDITDYVKADPAIGKADYFLQPQETDRATYNGKWYGIGSCYVIHHLYYNVEMLEKAGVQPPSTDAAKAWTWEEFVENARKLTLDAAGKHPGEDGFDANNIQQWGVSWATWNLPRDVVAYMNGGDFITKDGVCKASDPATVEAYQALADLMNKHHVAPQTAQLDQLGMSAVQMMASGKLAMLADGSWSVMDIATLGFKFGCGVLPKIKTAVTEAQAHMHVIAKGTKNPDAAWKLLSFLSSDDYQRGLCKVGLWLPSHTSLLTEEGLKSWITPGVHPDGYEQIATDYLAKHSRIYPYPPGYSEANTIITAALDPVWIGQASAADALTADVIKQAEDALAKAKA